MLEAKYTSFRQISPVCSVTTPYLSFNISYISEEIFTKVSGNMCQRQIKQLILLFSLTWSVVVASLDG